MENVLRVVLRLEIGGFKNGTLIDDICRERIAIDARIIDAIEINIDRKLVNIKFLIML